MKLFRFKEGNTTKPGVYLQEKYYNASSFHEDFNEQFFESDGLHRFQDFVEKNKEHFLELPSNVVLDSPVARPSKIVCIGLNYIDHATETGATPPTEPVIFMKSTTALAGPNNDVVMPRNSKKTDWEVELAVVIGKRASYVTEADAMDYVAGYCLHNDVSEREFQLEKGGTWDKGKGCDTFAPMGPFLVTKDEVNVGNLRLWLTLNGKIMQDGTTSNLIFSIAHIVSYVSEFMTLLPGDIISTGTPAGVGLGMNPQVYLKEGDVMELGIDGLGTQRQVVRAYAQ